MWLLHFPLDQGAFPPVLPSHSGFSLHLTSSTTRELSLLQQWGVLSSEPFCFAGRRTVSLAFWLIVRWSRVPQCPDAILEEKTLVVWPSVVSYWNFPSEWPGSSGALCYGHLEVSTLDLRRGSDQLRSLTLMGLSSLKGEDAAVLLETGIFLYKHKNLLKTRKKWCPQCGFRAEKMPLKGLGVWWSQSGEAFVFWPLWGRFPAGAFRIREPEGNFQKP